MITEVKGSRLLSTRMSTPSPRRSAIQVTTGLITTKPRMVRTMPQMPAAKLLTSISKPGLILPSQSESTLRIDQPPSGPMIIAPMNIGMSVPTMTPMVAMAPTTPPRVLLSPYPIRPPV